MLSFLKTEHFKVSSTERADDKRFVLKLEKLDMNKCESELSWKSNTTSIRKEKSQARFCSPECRVQCSARASQINTELIKAGARSPRSQGPGVQLSVKQSRHPTPRSKNTNIENQDKVERALWTRCRNLQKLSPKMKFPHAYQNHGREAAIFSIVKSL